MTKTNKVLCIGILGFLVSGTSCVKEVGVDETTYALSKCENLPQLPKFSENSEWFLSRDDRPQVSCDGYSAYYVGPVNKEVWTDEFLVSVNAEKCLLSIRRRVHCKVGRTDEQCAKVPDQNHNKKKDQIIADLIFRQRQIELTSETRTRKTLESFTSTCRWKH